MERRLIPELLAPAGSMDALKAAFNGGADAVYLSGKNFGARYYADNFSKAKLEKAINHAHLRDKKIYVTVNTLVSDYELEEVVDYLFWLYKVGVDAVILQDLGVASLCRELVPDLDMHASTQMTINNLDGVKWAGEFGFKRVVLARELSLPEVEEISKSVGREIELEIFAHGALCYSYSGQCLLSSVIGGRSGNRGRCAQPCRKPYQLLQADKDEYGKLSNPTPVDNGKNYLLSTRDLALYPHLDKISKIHLSSLKIEGRMRSPEYVALVVSIYRKALDDLLKGNWAPDKTESSKLKLAFNRGFTGGHLLETKEESVMGRDAPGNRGLYIGRVFSENKKKIPSNDIVIEISPGLPEFMLEKGDGVVFITPNIAKRYGMAVEHDIHYLNPHKLILNTEKQISPGSKVYLTRDVSLSREAKKIMEGQGDGSAIPLDISMRWDPENIPILEGKFKASCREFDLELEADFKMETARKKPTRREQILKQLKKTGGTSFNVNNIEMDYPGDLFIPLGKLNSFRREFIDKAESELLKSNRPSAGSVESAGERLRDFKKGLKSHFPPANSRIKGDMGIAVYTSNLEVLKGAIDGDCKRIYFEPFLWEEFKRRIPCKNTNWVTYSQRIQELVQDAQDMCTSNWSTLIWKWPSVIPNKPLEYLKELICPLSNQGLDEIMVGSMGALKAVQELDADVKVSGSMALNIWNHRSIQELSGDLNRITLSNELSKKELASATKYVDFPFEYVVQGNLESLVSEDCLLKAVHKSKTSLKPPWGIEDRKNHTFPLMVDDYARTHVMNSVELCLIDHIPDLYKIGLHDLVIDARGKTGEYARSMVTYYHQGLDFRDKTQVNITKLKELKSKVKKISQGGITTWNFRDRPE